MCFCEEVSVNVRGSESKYENETTRFFSGFILRLHDIVETTSAKVFPCIAVCSAVITSRNTAWCMAALSSPTSHYAQVHHSMI